MKKTNEIAKFTKYYKFYVIGLSLLIIYTAYIVFTMQGFVTLELIVASSFLVFLACMVYTGALIIELNKKIEDLEKSTPKKK